MSFHTVVPTRWSQNAIFFRTFLGACFTWSSDWHLIMLRLIRVCNENVSFEQAPVLETGVIAHRHSKKLIYPQSALTRWVSSTTLFWRVLEQIKLSFFVFFSFIFKRPSLVSHRRKFMRFYVLHTLVRDSYIYLITLFYCILDYFQLIRRANCNGKWITPSTLFVDKWDVFVLLGGWICWTKWALTNCLFNRVGLKHKLGYI